MHRLGTAIARLLDAPCPNPAFGLSHRAAAAEARRMQAHPAPPARPVLVLSGYRAWSFVPRALARRLRGLTGAPASNFAAMAFPWSTDFPTIAARAIALIHQRWPSPDPAWTTEVDVVAVSMGGLIARAAALGLAPGPRRLRIARLFTLATPHRGARLAELLPVDAAARAMRPGSSLLTRLDEALPHANYELVCYTRLRDTWVGATRAAPPGAHPHWVSGTRLLSHITVSMDERLLVDIARRLRAEPPFAQLAGPAPRD